MMQRTKAQKKDWQNLTEAMGKLSKVNLHIFDRAGMDIPYIWSKVRKIIRMIPKRKTGWKSFSPSIGMVLLVQ